MDAVLEDIQCLWEPQPPTVLPSMADEWPPPMPFCRWPQALHGGGAEPDPMPPAWSPLPPFVQPPVACTPSVGPGIHCDGGCGD